MPLFSCYYTGVSLPKNTNPLPHMDRGSLHFSLYGTELPPIENPDKRHSHYTLPVAHTPARIGNYLDHQLVSLANGRKNSKAPGQLFRSCMNGLVLLCCLMCSAYKMVQRYHFVGTTLSFYHASRQYPIFDI